MKKLPKDIQELLDNTPKMSKKSLKQLKKAAEELENDSEFQKEVEEGIREEYILHMKEAITKSWFIMYKMQNNDEAKQWRNDYDHLILTINAQYPLNPFFKNKD